MNTFKDCGNVCGNSMPFSFSEMRCKAIENSLISILPSESTSAKDQICAKTGGDSPEANINDFACSPVMNSDREELIRTNCVSYLAFWSAVITYKSDGELIVFDVCVYLLLLILLILLFIY